MRESLCGEGGRSPKERERDSHIPQAPGPEGEEQERREKSKARESSECEPDSSGRYPYQSHPSQLGRRCGPALQQGSQFLCLLVRRFLLESAIFSWSRLCSCGCSARNSIYSFFQNLRTSKPKNPERWNNSRCLEHLSEASSSTGAQDA